MSLNNKYFTAGVFSIFKSLGFWVFSICFLSSIWVGTSVAPTWSVEHIGLDVLSDSQGLYFIYREKKSYLNDVVSIENAQFNAAHITHLNQSGDKPSVTEEIVLDHGNYYKYVIQRHWGWWSLLPALTAVLLCWVVRDPLASLGGGIVVGAMLLGLYDLTDAVFIPQLMSKGSAGVLLLYLLLLGGLMGVWSRTGGAKAFAELMAKHFVRGPRTAKLVAWLLGVIFHQGGTMSTVLVGTTVKPLADEEKVSHEELSYIVDSTASPIAALIPLNAWPGYVQAFIFVSGVPFLATELDRVRFFWSSIPLSFYCILAVLFTFLLSIEKLPFVGKQMRSAMKRSRETGELDAKGSDPLSSKELSASDTVPSYYSPHVSEFFIPIAIIIGVSMWTFFMYGSPNVRWGFGLALVVAMTLALVRGMTLKDLVGGLENGLKGVVTGAVILLFAMTIGNISKLAGGGFFLVELLGTSIPYWILPVALQLLTMIISFSTGTSWGTYAVAFPLAMPLAVSVAAVAGLAHPEFFVLICFATVLNGSVFGDQCSPISDTTVLSAMVTGSDLMDHVKTQIVLAGSAAIIAGILWTALMLFV